MKIILFFLAIVLAPAAGAGERIRVAQAGSVLFTSNTNSHARQKLITNTAVYALAKPGNIFGYVPTNTVAYQEYALDTILKQINVFNERWQLELSKPITESAVTRFSATPKTNGMSAGIDINHRYSIGISNGRVENFRDLVYWLNAYENRPEKFQQTMLRATNLLTKASAEQLARDALKKLGLTEEQLNLREPPKVDQWTYQPDGKGKVYKLPHYEVEWKFKLPRGKNPKFAATAIHMEISGIISNVVSFENTSRKILTVPMPSNYWQMLGLTPPTNLGLNPSGEPGRSP